MNKRAVPRRNWVPNDPPPERRQRRAAARAAKRVRRKTPQEEAVITSMHMRNELGFCLVHNRVD